MDGNETWLIVKFIEELQLAWNQLSEMPFWCAIVHFSVSAFLSWPAARLFGTDSAQLKKKLAKISEILTEALVEERPPSKMTVKAHTAMLRNYILQYTFITGAVSAAIIHIQFNGTCQAPWAVFYGIIGPYALQEILMSAMGGKDNNVLSKETNKLFKLPTKIENSVNTDYQNELNRLNDVMESEIKDLGKRVVVTETIRSESDINRPQDNMENGQLPEGNDDEGQPK